MDTQHLTDLILKAQQGDTNAMEALIENCYQDIYYFAFKTVKNEDIAADITQESCLEITKTLANLREPGAFSVWARRITYHQCTRYFKKTKDVIPDLNEEGESIFDSLPDETGDTEPDAVYEDKEFKMTMRALVDSLPSEQSSALLLYYYEKMSVQQIAEIQGVPDGTVKSRLNYARKAFRQKVEEYENKTGVRLHAATPISVLLTQLFKQGFSELPIPQLSLPGTATASASAGAGGMGTVGASGGIATVGNAAAGAVGAVASVGSAAVGAVAGGTGSGDGKAPTDPKSKKTSKKAAAGSAAKAVAKKASESPENTADPKNKKNNKSKSPILPIICGLMITALLAAGAFVGVKYFMNRNKSSETLDSGDHKHAYTTNEWESDNDSHYKLCYVCDRTLFRSEHQYGNWLSDDTYHHQTCDVCNYSSQWVKHFAHKWQVDDTEHFKICEICNKTYASEEHTFDGWKYDETSHYRICDTCKQKFDAASHAFEWKYDKTHHYKLCECGTQIESAPHNYVNDICICGHTYLPFELNYQLNTDNSSYSVLSIGELNETTVVIPATFNNLPVTGIGNGAFANCTALASIVLPDSIEQIGHNAFMDCTSLASVNFGDGVTSIGYSAFENCIALTTITLPNSVTFIRENAFKGCTSLKSITLPSSLHYIPSYAFAGCTSLSEIKLPTYLREIGEYAFKGCTSLVSIDLPDALVTMGEGVFCECTSLKSIVLPDALEYLPAYSFYGCTALTDVVFPRDTSVAPEYENFGVGEYAFAECIRLENLDMEKNVSGFGAHAFENCISLKTFSIPTNYENVGFIEVDPYTFAGCTALESIGQPYDFYVIREGAFSGCVNLKTIDISGNYAEIYRDAFKDCHSLSIQFNGTSDNWHTVHKEEGWADPAMIVHCTDKSIDHLTHSYQLDMWSYNAETHWKSCECGVAEDEWMAEPHNIVDRICTVCGMEIGSDGLEFELNAEENGYILVYLGDCTDTEIYIPSMYNGLPVVGIGASVFEGCAHITAVHIPASVRFIGSSAFLGTSITEITIPDGVTVIEDNTFGMCQNLVSVSLPESVHSISMFAFSYCSSLAEINLDNVRFIGSFAFQNCTALTEITLHDALIEDNAFSGSGVVTVTLTGECELYASVFMGCKSLTSVYLPASITYIDICTFQNCVSLEHIYFDGTIEDWNNMDRMDYEEDMDEMEMDLLWNHNTGEYTIHCTDGDLAK